MFFRVKKIEHVEHRAKEKRQQKNRHCNDVKPRQLRVHIDHLTHLKLQIAVGGAVEIEDAFLQIEAQIFRHVCVVIVEAVINDAVFATRQRRAESFAAGDNAVHLARFI